MSVVVISAGQVENFTSLQINPSGTANSNGTPSFGTLVNAGQVVVGAGKAVAFGTIVGSGIIDIHPSGQLYCGGYVDFSQEINFISGGGTVQFDHPEDNSYLSNSVSAYSAPGCTIAFGSAGTVFGDTLGETGILTPGSFLISQDGTHSLLMQADGNLVAYHKTGTGMTAIWATGTSGHAGAYAEFRTAGYLCVYPEGGGQALYRSPSYGGVKCVMQNSGDVQILNAAGAVLWHSNTAGQ